VWAELKAGGAVVVTRDGLPMGIITPTSPATLLKASDPNDTVFLEVAAASGGKTLVTGNTRHYPPASRGSVRVLTPAEAWAEFTR
jgi:predicted nucleic acid-binding protein